MEEILEWLLGRSPIGSIWDAITGGSQNALNNALSLMINRPTPDLTQIMNLYDKTFYISLGIGAIVALIATAKAMGTGEGAAAVFKALVVDFIWIVIVGHSIPTLVTMGFTLSGELSAAIVGAIGDPADSGSYGLSVINPTILAMQGVQAVAYGIAGTLLLFEAVLLSFIPVILAVIGPLMFAFRNLGTFGANTNRIMWTGLLWSLFSFPVMVSVLVISNAIVQKLPPTFFQVGAAGNTLIVIVLFLTAAVPYLTWKGSKRLTVNVANGIRGTFQQSAGGSHGYRPSASSSIGQRAAHSQQTLRIATSLTEAATRGVTGESKASSASRDIAKQVAFAAAKSHPIAASAVTGATIISKSLTASKQSRPAILPPPPVKETGQNSTPPPPEPQEGGTK